MVRSLKTGARAICGAARAIPRTAAYSSVASVGRRYNSTESGPALESESQPSANTIQTPKYSKFIEIPQDIADFGGYKRKAELFEQVKEEDARKSPALIALKARLGLPESFPLSLLARTLTCRTGSNTLVDNASLAILGKNILSYYAVEHLLVKYPRLPPAILNVAVNAYIGAPSLAAIGAAWGVEPDSRSGLQRYLSDEPKEYSLGKLRYLSEVQEVEDGVLEYANDDKYHTDYQKAMAVFVRALIGALYAQEGLAYVREFVSRHILSREVDVSTLFEFQHATRELAVLCLREGYEAPVSRLLAETGRLSASPVFVVGVFSGTNKLGEGQGASLNEAKIRASVNALKSWYLYSPLDPVLPSDFDKEVNPDSRDEDYSPVVIDSGAIVH